nr:hypothetical protein CFP56_49104 [Quercus suber]
MEDIAPILPEARKAESFAYINTRPPYPEKMARKPYSTNYTPFIFPKYDGMMGNASEHIRRFRDLSLICYDLIEEERLMDICIVGTLYEYCPYLKNLQIPYFTRLVEVSRRTSMSVRKPAKGLTSQTPSATRKPWKRESKKVEIVVEAYEPMDAQTQDSNDLFIGCEDLMEEEAGNAASNSAIPVPLQDEEMTLRIQQDDKVHIFLKGIGLKPLAKREATQALIQLVERSQKIATSKGSLL